MMRIPFRRQSGFTLIELLIVMFALGVVLAIFSSAAGRMLTMQRIAKQEQDAYENMLVGRSMAQYATRQQVVGSLPDDIPDDYPVPNSSDILHDTGGVLDALYIARGLSPHKARHDGTANKNQRSYRKFERTDDEPLFGASGGPMLTLTIQHATVLMLADAQDKGLAPDALVTLDSNGDPQFHPSLGTEIPAYQFSNRVLQESLLGTTAQRVTRIRQALSDYVSAERANDMDRELLNNEYSNFYPASDGDQDYRQLTGATDDGSVSNLAGAGNARCYQNWISLTDIDSSSTSPDVLSRVGLVYQEHGRTAWGKSIEFCPNYIPPGVTMDPDKPPFYGAIRFRKDVVNDAGNWVHITL
ncbi:type II secretion system protein [Vreelandella rituensis]|uniref:Type II secretion system protein n=1 Tax=Vreelandella rituensis TaxID=2282306 RepID=A0A368UA62_9GAMM|nr:type II secretion system protein [Halomonas rituensis]RCV93874.1 type II secretion system protein [Halomonas rituensis]